MASVTLDEAFKQAVKSFYDGAGFEEYEKVKGKSKYSKGMFDGYEKDMRKGLAKEAPKAQDDVEIEGEEDASK